MNEKTRRFLLKWFERFDRRSMLSVLSDTMYLKLLFRLKFDKALNLNTPQTFNEKLQYLKLYDRKPIYTQMVDKYSVKEYVSDIIGSEYIIPTLGIWDSFDDIDFDTLPEKFVLKCTHDSGGLVICRDKSKLDKEAARKKIEKSLKTNYYWRGREWPYKNVPARIMAEAYMQDGDNESLPVYKFFCFGGRACIIQTIQNDKTPDETIDYFDREWTLLDLKQNFPNSLNPLVKPNLFDKMLEIADVLAKVKKNFIRVDLYYINGKIYFSEFTFFSDSGMAVFHPEHWDERLGEMIDLSL